MLFTGEGEGNYERGRKGFAMVWRTWTPSPCLQGLWATETTSVLAATLAPKSAVYALGVIARRLSRPWLVAERWLFRHACSWYLELLLQPAAGPAEFAANPTSSLHSSAWG